ncbi:GTP cyclohydrolase 1 [Picochlorum sp. SENEW3]|nr:GTP cyclohydrolase 1 [Picochlorum sp. SENEW3]
MRTEDEKKTWQKSTFQHMCEYQVEMFSKRLQVQERLTQQIADGIWGCLGDDHMVKEIMVVCQHMCMIARGVQQHCTSTL